MPRCHKNVIPLLYGKGMESQNTKPYCIEIADDEGIILLWLSRTVARLCDRVVTAVNGEQAVQVYRNHKPPIVLLDISMPLKDGLEAAREIRDLARKEGAFVYLIALTANPFTPEIRDTFDAFLGKPVKTEALVGLLKQVRESILV